MKARDAWWQCVKLWAALSERAKLAMPPLVRNLLSKSHLNAEFVRWAQGTIIYRSDSETIMTVVGELLLGLVVERAVEGIHASAKRSFARAFSRHIS